MKKLVGGAVLALVLLAGAGMSGTAQAHNVGPCNDSGESGNSDYATHYTVPATLGQGASIPGSFGGFSVCLGTGRVFHQP